MNRNNAPRAGRLRVNKSTNELVPDDATGGSLVWRTYLSGSIEDVLRCWGGFETVPQVREEFMNVYQELLKVSGRQLFEAYHLDSKSYLAFVLTGTDRTVAAYANRTNVDSSWKLPSSSGVQHAGYWRTPFSNYAGSDPSLTSGKSGTGLGGAEVATYSCRLYVGVKIKTTAECQCGRNFIDHVEEDLIWT